MKTTLSSIVTAIAVLTLVSTSSMPVFAATVTLNPDGAGWKTELNFVGAASNWLACTSDDGDTSYVHTNDSGYKPDFYNLTDVSLTGTINSVTVYIKARAAATPTQDGYKIGIRTGDTYYADPGQLTATYADYSYSWVQNPDTAAVWTWAEINDLQAGVALRRSAGTSPASSIASRCTRIWVVVDYTPSEVVCKTAFAFGGASATCFLDIENLQSNRWGWTNGPLAEGSYIFDLYAAAGQCDLSKGTLVGEVTVVYTGGTATVTYGVNPGFTLNEVHLYVGGGILPMKDGQYTVAPGQYPYSGDGSAPFVISGLSGDIYVIAHAVVCGVFPAEE